MARHFKRDEWNQNECDDNVQLIFFMFYQQDTRLVPFLAFGMTSESRERVQNTIALIAKGSLLDEFPCVM